MQVKYYIRARKAISLVYIRYLLNKIFRKKLNTNKCNIPFELSRPEVIYDYVLVNKDFITAWSLMPKNIQYKTMKTKYYASAVIEQDKSPDIERKPPFGVCKKSNTLPKMRGGLQTQREHDIIWKYEAMCRRSFRKIIPQIRDAYNFDKSPNSIYFK